MQDEYNELPDDAAGPDYAFEDVYNKGWIRVAIPPDASVFIINFNQDATTVQALKALIKLLNIHFTDMYAIETGEGFKEVPTEKQMKAIISKLIVAKRK